VNLQVQDIVNLLKEMLFTFLEVDLESVENIDISDIYISSLNYVEYIVNIENTFNMEFEDEYLVEGKFESFYTLAEYVKSRMTQ
jgi:acyl carrier protein